MFRSVSHASPLRRVLSSAPVLRGGWDWFAERFSTESEEAPFYGYAKKLELKNRLRDADVDPDALRERIQRRTLTPEESLLAVDLLRKHKAMRRDVRRLKRTTQGHSAPLAAYKPRPFAHSDPASHRITRAIVHQLRAAEAVTKREEKAIGGHQLMQIPEEESESVGSLEDLELRFGTPRPPRPSRTPEAFSLPLSRPNLRPFHSHKPQTLQWLDCHFAEWFIGMTEAQLPFKYTSEGRPYFAVYHSDRQLFGQIYSYLHFGHVDEIKQMWYVIDDENLRRLMYLLNGNLFLAESRAAFRDWVQKYRSLGTWLDPFDVTDTAVWRPQLNNKWLMGWIDSSYGMFAGRLVESSTFPHFRINLKFWILSQQRPLLEHLQRIFGGGEIEPDGEYLRWTLKRRKEHIRLNQSITQSIAQLRNVNLERHYRLVYYPIVKVKTQRAWDKLQRLIHSLNQYERKLALGIDGHPYRQRYKSNTETQMQLARTGAEKAEVVAFKREQERKDFPLWDTPRCLTLIQETD